MRFYLFFIGVFMVGGLWAQEPTYRDVDYVGDGHPRHTLDVYIPPGTAGPTKTVVYIHGGWWLSGSKGRTMGYCEELYRSGYVVVGINYRLSMDSIFPAQIYDCKAAIRYLKTYADIFQIDTCNIGVTGESAGGHLSALLGTSIGESSLEGLHLGSTGASSDVHAVLDFFGPTSFNEMDGNEPESCTRSIVHNSDNSGESLLVGCRIGTCPDLVKRADPITYINGNEPPFSIHHGDSDCLIPPNQSILLHNALELSGMDTELIIYEGGGHGDFIDANVKKKMIRYFNEKLNNNCDVSTAVNPIETGSREINIYPLPSSGIINIEGLERPMSVYIYSIQGQLLWQEKAPGQQIDISELAPGSYILSIPEAGLRRVVVKE